MSVRSFSDWAFEGLYSLNLLFPSFSSNGKEIVLSQEEIERALQKEPDYSLLEKIAQMHVHTLISEVHTGEGVSFYSRKVKPTLCHIVTIIAAFAIRFFIAPLGVVYYGAITGVY